MVRFQTDLRVWLASMLVGLTTISGAPAATMVEDAALACGGLAGSLDEIGRASCRERVCELV